MWGQKQCNWEHSELAFCLLPPTKTIGQGILGGGNPNHEKNKMVVFRTHLLRSSESIISRCFSFSALVASSPASLSSSSRLVSTGFQVVPAGFPSLVFSRGRVPFGGACGIVALIASFWISSRRLLIFRIIFVKRARACETGSCSSVWDKENEGKRSQRKEGGK